MAGAAREMAAELAGITLRDPFPCLIANGDGHVLDTAAACRTELVEHLTAGVDWVRAVERMTSAGVDLFLEVGPGRVLTGLIRRIAPEATVLPLDDPAAPDRLAVPFKESLRA
jgi:[acyl-carrier-protein] S-malonyltransferase